MTFVGLSAFFKESGTIYDSDDVQEAWDSMIEALEAVKDFMEPQLIENKCFCQEGMLLNEDVCPTCEYRLWKERFKGMNTYDFERKHTPTLTTDVLLDAARGVHLVTHYYADGTSEKYKVSKSPIVIPKT